MADRNYYVICDNGCKFPAMTKEQTLAAIKQAVETGKIKDVDAGFITTIKEQNSGLPLTFWIGTQAEYNAIEAKTHNCFYIITDDTTGEDIKRNIEELKTAVESINATIAPTPEIIVTVQAGGVVCEDENGDNVKGTQDGNVFRFFPSSYGVYTLIGTYGGVTRTQQVNVTAVQQYTATIEFYEDNFADNDWETIASLIQSGRAPDTWRVGDSKDDIIIIGKNHDEYENGEIAPFTFIVTNTDYVAAMNEEGTNAGGWAESDGRTKVMPTAKTNLIPEALRDQLRAVKKLSTAGEDSTELVETIDELFLLSERELEGGTGIAGIEGEGKRYSYFSNGNLLPKTAWTRTAIFTNCFVVSRGYSGGAKSDHAYMDHLIYPAFCL